MGMEEIMVKTIEEICKDIANIVRQDTGNVVESIITYQVKRKQVMLLIEKTPSGKSQHYKVLMDDFETNDHSETDILFQEYPHRCIDHSTIVGNNNNRVYMNNSGVRNGLRDIQKALAMLYRMGVEKQHI